MVIESDPAVSSFSIVKKRKEMSVTELDDTYRMDFLQTNKHSLILSVNLIGMFLGLERDMLVMIFLPSLFLVWILGHRAMATDGSSR